MFRKWKPSKAAAMEYKQTMDRIETWLQDHPDVSASRSRDSYYFTIDGQSYRVSNHSIESSNKRAFDWTGQQVRDKYHPDGRDAETKYIHAGKTRIIEIYDDIKAGHTLDGHGRRIA